MPISRSQWNDGYGAVDRNWRCPSVPYSGFVVDFGLRATARNRRSPPEVTVVGDGRSFPIPPRAENRLRRDLRLRSCKSMDAFVISSLAYPVLGVMYAGGISALAAGRYDMLRICLTTPVLWDRSRNEKARPILLPVVAAVTDIFNAFIALPGMDRKYVPRSEHQLVALQHVVEDQLFLGRSYQDLFDQFEIRAVARNAPAAALPYSNPMVRCPCWLASSRHLARCARYSFRPRISSRLAMS